MYHRKAGKTLALLLVAALLIPYAKAAVPTGGIIYNQTDTTYLVPHDDSENQIQNPNAEPRSSEELLREPEVLVGESGDVTSVQIKEDSDITAQEIAGLFMERSAAAYQADDGLPETSPDTSMSIQLQKKYGKTEADVDEAVSLHGDMSRLQGELKALNTALRYYELEGGVKNAIAELIFGGYSNSQAFSAYVAEAILGLSRTELLASKQAEIEEERAQADEEEQDCPDADIKSLAIFMGLPYEALSRYVNENNSNPDILRNEFSAAKTAFYAISSPELMASSGAENQYAPEQILDKPFSYDTVGDVSVNMNKGTYQYRETDLSIPGVNGLDLNFTRIFDSSNSWIMAPMGMYDESYANLIAVEVGYKCYLWENWESKEEKPIYSEIADIGDYSFSDPSFN